MVQYIEFVGKNVDKALEKASLELNLSVEKLKYDVVSYGSSGIFGLVGAKKAKIRIKSASIHARIAKDAKEQARDLVKDAFKDDSKEPSREPAKKPVKKDTKEQARELVEETFQSVDKPSSTKSAPVDLEKPMAIGMEALKRLVDFISDGASIKVESKEQRLLYKVDGGNSGLLIGKRGQTLEAMQYLVEKIVNKQSEQRVRVLVDVEGYLKTRKQNLQKMATRMAEKAQKTQKPVTIGQMNAYDRRTVHVQLKNNRAVRTQSVGDGYYRKLIIFPKKQQRSRQNKS